MNPQCLAFALLISATCGCSATTLIPFSDSATIQQGPPASLDTSAFMNSVISSDFDSLFGGGVFAEFVGIGTSNIFFSYILTGSLQFSEVSVFGVPSGGPITLTLSGERDEVVELTSIGAEGFVFDTSSADLNQVFELRFDGLDPENSISFDGTFRVPEPTSFALLGLSILGCLITRQRS